MLFADFSTQMKSLFIRIFFSAYIEDIQVFGVNMSFISLSEVNFFFILYFTVKTNVYQNLIKLVFSLI